LTEIRNFARISDGQESASINAFINYIAKAFAEAFCRGLRCPDRLDAGLNALQIKQYSAIFAKITEYFWQGHRPELHNRIKPQLSF